MWSWKLNLYTKLLVVLGLFKVRSPADVYLVRLLNSIIEELIKAESESKINAPHVSQALTAIIQIGLVDLLKSFRVTPVAVVGHSMGEIGAA